MTDADIKKQRISERDDPVNRIVLPALCNAIAAFPGVERVILFGSRVIGNAEERSDIDIAIVCPAANNRHWLDICQVTEETDTLLKIDLVRLDEAPLGFRQQIERKGKVLYERRQC